MLNYVYKNRLMSVTELYLISLFKEKHNSKNHFLVTFLLLQVSLSGQLSCCKQ